jgi:hypothetical protein
MVRIHLPPAKSPQRTMDAGLVTSRSGEGDETDLPAVIDASRGVAAAGIPEIRLWASGPHLPRGTKATELASS